MAKDFIYEIECGEEDPFIVSYDVYDLADEFVLDILTEIVDSQNLVRVTFYDTTDRDAREMLNELRKSYARVD
jgi:hypothetical protein